MGRKSRGKPTKGAKPGKSTGERPKPAGQQRMGSIVSQIPGLPYRGEPAEMSERLGRDLGRAAVAGMKANPELAKVSPAMAAGMGMLGMAESTGPLLTTRTGALGPAEVLDLHARLTSDMKSPPPKLVDYLNGFIETTLDRSGKEGGDQLRRKALTYLFYPATNGRQLTQVLHRQLAEARTYQVTGEMVDVVTAAYEKSLSRVSHMDSREIPSESGFAWFDTPVRMRDSYNRVLLHRAMSWSLQTIHMLSKDAQLLVNSEDVELKDDFEWPGVRITTWCHADDVDDYWDAEVMEDLRALVGDLTMAHSVIVPFEQRFLHRSERANDGLIGDDIARWMHTLFLFLTDEITVDRPAQLPRADRRRAQRSLKHGEVSVISLRKVHNIAEPSGLHRDVAWSCRWVVAGHYRHLEHYEEPRHEAAPLGYDRTHCFECGGRITSVRAHMKGPPGAPLKSNVKTLYKLRK